MLDLLYGLAGPGAVVVAGTYYYERRWHRFRKSLHEQAGKAKHQLDQRAERREIEARCPHKKWTEVLGIKSGELLALLCSDCQETLYLDEGYGVHLEANEKTFKPSGCSCRPAEEVYSTLCPLSHHSGKAKVLAALKAAQVTERREAVIIDDRDLAKYQIEERSRLYDEFDWRWKRAKSQALDRQREALTPYRPTEYSSGQLITPHTSDLFCSCEKCQVVSTCSHCASSWDRTFAATRDIYANGRMSWGDIEKQLGQSRRNLANAHVYHYDTHCTACTPWVHRAANAVTVFKDRRHITEEHIGWFFEALGAAIDDRHSQDKHLNSHRLFTEWLGRAEVQAAKRPLSAAETFYRATNAPTNPVYWSEGRRRQELIRADLKDLHVALTTKPKRHISPQGRAVGGFVAGGITADTVYIGPVIRGPNGLVIKNGLVVEPEASYIAKVERQKQEWEILKAALDKTLRWYDY